MSALETEGEGGGLDPNGVITMAFDNAVPPREATTWARLTPAQKLRAAQRMSALLAWKSGAGCTTADAAAEAGVSVSRFYRIAADWRSTPSLAALGTFAVGTKRSTKLDPVAVSALQKVLPRVVRLNAGASVSRVVELLIAEAGVDRERLPGMTKLREMVEEELRRLSAVHDAGTAIVFDCVATSLPRSDGRPHVVFACIDRGTRMILGLSLGFVEDAAAGFARSARDAMVKIDGSPHLPWGRRLARVEITAGEDLAACEKLVAKLTAAVPGTNFQLARRSGRYGRYLRSLVGPRLGTIVFTPTRTVIGGAVPVNGDTTPWSDDEALAAIRRAADAHNEGALGEAACERPGPPPLTLLAALREMSASFDAF